MGGFGGSQGPPAETQATSAASAALGTWRFGGGHFGGGHSVNTPYALWLAFGRPLAARFRLEKPLQVETILGRRGHQMLTSPASAFSAAEVQIAFGSLELILSSSHTFGRAATHWLFQDLSYLKLSPEYRHPGWRFCPYDRVFQFSTVEIDFRHISVGEIGTDNSPRLIEHLLRSFPLKVAFSRCAAVKSASAALCPDQHRSPKIRPFEISVFKISAIQIYVRQICCFKCARDRSE